MEERERKRQSGGKWGQKGNERAKERVSQRQKMEGRKIYKRVVEGGMERERET